MPTNSFILNPPAPTQSDHQTLSSSSPLVGHQGYGENHKTAASTPPSLLNNSRYSPTSSTNSCGVTDTSTLNYNLLLYSNNAYPQQQQQRSVAGGLSKNSPPKLSATPPKTAVTNGLSGRDDVNDTTTTTYDATVNGNSSFTWTNGSISTSSSSSPPSNNNGVSGAMTVSSSNYSNNTTSTTTSTNTSYYENLEKLLSLLSSSTNLTTTQVPTRAALSKCLLQLPPPEADDNGQDDNHVIFRHNNNNPLLQENNISSCGSSRDSSDHLLVEHHLPSSFFNGGGGGGGGSSGQDEDSIVMSMPSFQLLPTDSQSHQPSPGGPNNALLLGINALTSSSSNSCSTLLNANKKKGLNMTECVPVPSSEHVAEIVGRQGCKIKALRAKTNTYIKTPVRGEEPVFVVTGRKEDVVIAKREILTAAEHFSALRASRKQSAPSISTLGFNHLQHHQDLTEDGLFLLENNSMAGAGVLPYNHPLASTSEHMTIYDNNHYQHPMGEHSPLAIESSSHNLLLSSPSNGGCTPQLPTSNETSSHQQQQQQQMLFKLLQSQSQQNGRCGAILSSSAVLDDGSTTDSQNPPNNNPTNAANGLTLSSGGSSNDVIIGLDNNINNHHLSATTMMFQQQQLSNIVGHHAAGTGNHRGSLTAGGGTVGNYYQQVGVPATEPSFGVRAAASINCHLHHPHHQHSNSLSSLLPNLNQQLQGQITIRVRVPYKVVGLVVGPKGATIKRIQQSTQTYIVTPSRDREPVFEITGTPTAVHTARIQIENHIAVRTANGANMTGTGAGGEASPNFASSSGAVNDLLSSFSSSNPADTASSNFAVYELINNILSQLTATPKGALYNNNTNDCHGNSALFHNGVTGNGTTPLGTGIFGSGACNGGSGGNINNTSLQYVDAINLDGSSGSTKPYHKIMAHTSDIKNSGGGGGVDNQKLAQLVKLVLTAFVASSSQSAPNNGAAVGNNSSHNNNQLFLNDHSISSSNSFPHQTTTNNNYLSNLLVSLLSNNGPGNSHHHETLKQEIMGALASLSNNNNSIVTAAPQAPLTNTLGNSRHRQSCFGDIGGPNLTASAVTADKMDCNNNMSQHGSSGSSAGQSNYRTSNSNYNFSHHSLNCLEDVSRDTTNNNRKGAFEHHQQQENYMEALSLQYLTKQLGAILKKPLEDSLPAPARGGGEEEQLQEVEELQQFYNNPMLVARLNKYLNGNDGKSNEDNNHHQTGYNEDTVSRLLNSCYMNEGGVVGSSSIISGITAHNKDWTQPSPTKQQHALPLSAPEDEVYTVEEDMANFNLFHPPVGGGGYTRFCSDSLMGAASSKFGNNTAAAATVKNVSGLWPPPPHQNQPRELVGLKDDDYYTRMTGTADTELNYNMAQLKLFQKQWATANGLIYSEEPEEEEGLVCKSDSSNASYQNFLGAQNWSDQTLDDAVNVICGETINNNNSSNFKQLLTKETQINQ